VTRHNLTRSLVLALATASVGGFAANAGTVYNNIGPASYFADCSFSTTCASNHARGNEFAAQAFTLATSATITSGAFTELDIGTTPTDVNYSFYADVGGLPSGLAIISGVSSLTATPLGVINTAGTYNHTLESFDTASVALGPGNYFFAIQAVSPTEFTYLEQGFVASGAAETHNVGGAWSAGYENSADGTSVGGLSVALYDSPAPAPEPATWTMMLIGLGGLGVRMRARRTASLC